MATQAWDPTSFLNKNAPHPQVPTGAPFQFEGDDLYFTDGVDIRKMTSGAPLQVAAMPFDTVALPDGTSAQVQRSLSAFWVEPTRFVAVSDFTIVALPRDGSPSTDLSHFENAAVHEGCVARDDHDIYVVTMSVPGEQYSIFAVPLAGGTPREVAKLGSASLPKALYLDDSSVYVLAYGASPSDEDTVSRFGKDGSDLGRVQLPGLPLGFDRGAFYVDFDDALFRVTMDGARVKVAEPNGLSFTPETYVPSPEGTGYVWGWASVDANSRLSDTALMRLSATDASASVASCQPDDNSLVLAMTAHGDSVYALVEGHNTWTIAKMPR
jgi:hypothetical protein